MALSRRPLTLAAVGTLAALLSLVVLMAVGPTADAEGIDLYEFETIEASHGANAVAVMADGSEAVVLYSDYNSTLREYTNYVYTTTGTSLTERTKFTGQNWYWLCAAFDPGGDTAVLGGTRGYLYTYSEGSVGRVNTGLPYDFTAVDWHPTSHTAYLGTSSNAIYIYSGGSISLMDRVTYSTRDLDVRPDGGEIAVSSYSELTIYNATIDDWSDLPDPVGDQGEEYYWVYALEYTNNGKHLLASWRDRRGGYALMRYTFESEQWSKVHTTGTWLTSILWENEGTFALLGMSNNLQYLQAGRVAVVDDWFSTGATAVRDIAFNDVDFYFLLATDSAVIKFRRKDNVKPWLNRHLPDFEFDEDDPEGGDNLIDMLSYVRDDRDPSKLRFEFEFQQSEDLLEGSADGHYLDFEQKVPHWNGKMAFRVRITDSGYDDIPGTVDDLSNRTNVFNVTVRPVNDPISLVKVGEKTVGEDDLVFIIDEGEWLNLTLETEDVDNDPPGAQPPVFKLNRTLPSLKVDQDASLLSFLPRNKDVGTQFVNLTVDDKYGSSDWAHLLFHVRNVNNPPRLVGVRDTTVKEDAWLNFTVSARDPDLDIGMPELITFSTNRTDGVGEDDLPNFSFTVDQGEGPRIQVSFLPTNDDVGEIGVEVRVRDNSAPPGTWQDIRTMTITVVNTNDAPVLVKVNGVTVGDVKVLPIEAVEDEELEVTFSATDDDRDVLTFYVDDSRFRLSQPGGGNSASILYVPTNDDVGNIRITISVWDVHNTFDDLDLNVTVVNVNDPPVILSFEAQDAEGVETLAFTLYEDELFTAPIAVRDIDSAHIIFSDSEGLLEITVDPNDPHRALANFTPTQADTGSLSTVLEVEDVDGGVDVLTLELVVLGTNDPPGATTVTQLGGEASLTISLVATRVTDPDGDQLIYRWDFGDHSPTVSEVDLLEVEHRYPRPGTYTLTVTVDDGHGGTTPVSIEVIVPEVDDLPQETEVEEGPVGLIAALIIVFTLLAVIFAYLYWTRPGRRQG